MFVKVTKKYQRRASTPTVSNTSSLLNSASGAAGRNGSPESAALTSQVQVHPAQLAAWESRIS